MRIYLENCMMRKNSYFYIYDSKYKDVILKESNIIMLSISKHNLYFGFDISQMGFTAI